MSGLSRRRCAPGANRSAMSPPPNMAHRCWPWAGSGIRVRGRRSTPGRYFQVAQPGSGWGGTNIDNPLDIIQKIDPAVAWPGLRLLMVSTTGDHSMWLELDENLMPVEKEMPQAVRKTVERI